ncbi:hypothetical protein AEAC466_09560 [Asticcacaulis sp. AC466]|uniref:GGDEF domain-containing protein n=1 Tax=Asticcacaulis sp. AC466 TaxID=1282362 RepID=UPI0003C40106|nr:GGDEF domain-containing protein [Asticcacaulis sp. AC466]ESQ84589.1 hypothetical protein AEAC466_09560 [Asticcacaulis sp. AC466]
MGLDSHLQKLDSGSENDLQAFDEAAGKPARATTASMQSLLAHYFESQAFDNRHFEPNTVHALSDPQSETRAIKSEDLIETLHVSEAAFVPLTPVAQPPQPQPQSESPPHSPSSLIAQADWSPSARELIDSLMKETERLNAQVEQLTLQLQAAQGQADNDVLTPTLNRRAFLREVHRCMADCRRYGEEACLIFLDMDGFKSINDSYGHAAGDAALIYVAETLNNSVREGDSVGRMGGDEFAILLRHADLKSSRIKAMKLEAELMMGTFEHAGLYLKAGGSFGVRAYAAQASAEAWVSEADAAMFLAKKASR